MWQEVENGLYKNYGPCKILSNFMNLAVSFFRLFFKSWSLFGGGGGGGVMLEQNV